ncbi:MAG: hypothetical protein EAZ57_10715 [Cytophagales bacterium]|nr:MAG: hypothetical protein EAZ67_11320 [Cytophagales bacterium]TAF59547.1 MAG: hypothetical protein EAZ57_10715 [Cytophagales bacterium]
MNLGEKVRLIHDTVEGIIVAFLSGNILEIETPDGFKIQVPQREVVRVSSSEELYFSAPKPDKIVLSKPLGTLTTDRVAVSQSGLYLAFTAANAQSYNLNLVNYSEWDALFVVLEERGGAHALLYSGAINKGKFHKVTETGLSQLDKKAILVFQILLHREGIFKMQEPLVRHFDFITANFAANLKVAPLLRKEAFLFELLNYSPTLITKQSSTTQSSEPQIDPLKLKEKMLSGNQSTENIKQYIKKSVTPPPQEVDLHIEKLLKESSHLSNAQIVQYQLEVFIKTLDNAVASGMSEITIIHGVGNGVLRNEIHKKLSKHPHIKFFQDAKREKFGYGATIITFV